MPSECERRCPGATAAERLCQRRRRSRGGTMDIGSAMRTLRVEPVVDPVPRGGEEGAELTDARTAWFPAPAGGGMSAPDYAEPLIGWRAWIVTPSLDALTLADPETGAEWKARREVAAACTSPAPRLARRLGLRRAHEAPAAGCSCGIRAAASPALAAAALDRAGASSTTGVLGQAALWGTVVECEGGWRASRSYPARLYLAAPRERSRRSHHVNWLAYRLACYGVPVEVLACRGPGELVSAIVDATALPRTPPGDP